MREGPPGPYHAPTYDVCTVASMNVYKVFTANADLCIHHHSKYPQQGGKVFQGCAQSKQKTKSASSNRIRSFRITPTLRRAMLITDLLLGITLPRPSKKLVPIALFLRRPSSSSSSSRNITMLTKTRVPLLQPPNMPHTRAHDPALETGVPSPLVTDGHALHTGM